MDLSEYDFRAEGKLKLDGEWIFIRSELADPEAALKNLRSYDYGYVRVPKSWSRLEINGKPLPRQGYGTYILSLKFPKTDEPLLLKVPYISSSYALYINGKLAASNGVVGRSMEESRPQYRTNIIPIVPGDDGRADIVIHVSNFHYRRGGIWKSLILGTKRQIERADYGNLAYTMFLFGGLFITSLYHFCLHLLYRKDRSMLYFGLFTMMMALRLLVLDDVIVTRFFPSFNWELHVKIEYLSLYLSAPFFVIFLESLYPSEVKSWVVNLTKWFGILFTAIVLFTPARIYSKTLYSFYVVMLVAMAYSVFAVILATSRRRIGAYYIFLWGPFMSISAINDILFHASHINTFDMVPLGSFVLVIIQSLVVAQKYKHTSELAIIDPLTGVYNRNFIYPELKHLIKIAERYNQPFSLVLIDLDNFKKYNDTYGHIDGDSLLHSITKNLKRNLRESDLIGRFGGDEFIILPNTNGPEASQLMERLEQKLESEVLFTNNIVTLSYGIATYPKDGKSINELLTNADKALYSAKDLRKMVRKDSHGL